VRANLINDGCNSYAPLTVGADAFYGVTASGGGDGCGGSCCGAVFALQPRRVRVAPEQNRWYTASRRPVTTAAVPIWASSTVAMAHCTEPPRILAEFAGTGRRKPAGIRERQQLANNAFAVLSSMQPIGPEPLVTEPSMVRAQEMPHCGGRGPKR
jgi:hypothetical protein